MNQNDYMILFDDNGKPYISHGILDSAKSAVSNAAKGVGRGVRENHKYILKVLENGKNRYFYTQDEVKAYYQAKRMGVKNAAEYVQKSIKGAADNLTGKTDTQNAVNARKQADDAKRWESMTERAHKENLAAFKKSPTEENLARSKQSGQALTKAKANTKRANTYADEAQKAAERNPANRVKSAYERMKEDLSEKAQETRQAVTDRVDNARSSVTNTANSIKNAAQETANRAQTAADNQAAKVKNAVKTRTDDVRNKLNDMQKQRKTEKELSAAEKKQKATDDYYQERRASGFQDTQSILGSLNKGRSEYSNESIDTKIASALKADGVDMIESSDPKIRQAQNSIVNSRKSLEQHTLDYEHAQKYSEEAAKRAERAEEAYWAIVGDGTSSQDAIRQAKQIMRDAAADKKQSDREIRQLEKMLDDDQKAYHSAIQIYNMQRHINKIK